MGLVYNFIQDLSQLRNPSYSTWQPSGLTNEDPSLLKEIIETSPSLYPDEMLSDAQEIKIAVATIWQALWHNIHLSQKNVTKVAQDMISWVMDGRSKFERFKEWKGGSSKLIA